MGNNFCGDRCFDRGTIRTEISTTVEAGVKVGDTTPDVAAAQTTDYGVFYFEEHDDKAKMIQSKWRKKKEREAMLQKVRVLDENIATLGKYISVEEMKSKISPQIMKIRNDLKALPEPESVKSIDKETLIYRKPLQFNCNNSIYHGQWSKAGFREGYGVYIDETGSLQEGYFREGKLFFGRIFDYDGCYYEGGIHDGEPQGTGRRFGSDGQVYTGQWKNGKQNFEGLRVYKDGYKYVGMFKDNFFNGKGKFYWPDGCLFEGDFSMSKIEGSGRFKSPDGEIYEGGWKNNLPHGKGIYIYAGRAIGHKYEGEYKNGKKDGFGKFIFRNDTHYIGDWKKGLPHGNGEYKVKDNIYKGFWRHSRLVYNEKNDTTTLDININVDKEKFKLSKSELVHLVDEFEGVIKNADLNPARSFKASQGSELLGKFFQQAMKTAEPQTTNGK